MHSLGVFRLLLWHDDLSCSLSCWSLSFLLLYLLGLSFFLLSLVRLISSLFFSLLFPKWLCISLSSISSS